MARLSAVPASTQRQVADLVASRLRRHAEGPLDSSETWYTVAQSMGVDIHLYNAPGAGRGEWRASPPDGTPAVVAINTAYPDHEICLAWVHELAELLMHQMQPPLLFDGSDAGRYEGEPKDVQHRIARKVERILLG